MANYRNTCEGGTNGTSITAASGGSVDGSVAWNSVNTVASGTLIWDNAHAVLGNLSHKIATGATSGMSTFSWTTNITYALPMYISLCGYFTAIPAAGHRILTVLSGTNVQTGLNVNASGKIQGIQNGGAQGTITAATIPLNAWWRAELKLITASATVGQIEVRYYTDPFSAIPFETNTSTATLNTSTGTPSEIRFGIGVGTANVAAFWLDELQASDTAYPPPPQWRRSNSGLWTPHRQAAMRSAVM